MSRVDELRQSLPEFARDIKLNVQAVLEPSSLTEDQVWGVAVATAAAARNPRVLSAVLADASERASADTVDDAKAAAALMGMNNVFYRFRHMVENSKYAEIPARLRMNRIARPKTGRVDFELYCLAVSAVNGCESCIVAHEKTVLEGGLTEQHVHDAVRIAATFHAVAVALELT